jgi:hypothetical protein
MDHMEDLFPDSRWQLLGPDDDLTPEWLADLLNTVGTAEEWASIGMAVLDAEGNPVSVRVEVVLRDDGPVTVWGPSLEEARLAEEDVDSRWFGFALIDGEEASGLPRCVDAGARAPWA